VRSMSHEQTIADFKSLRELIERGPINCSSIVTAVTDVRKILGRFLDLLEGKPQAAETSEIKGVFPIDDLAEEIFKEFKIFVPFELKGLIRTKLKTAYTRGLIGGKET